MGVSYITQIYNKGQMIKMLLWLYSCFSFISGEKNLQEFPFPTLLHGEYDDSENVGVLVFLDLHTSNFKLCDPELQRISSHDQIEKVISTLGHFRTFLQNNVFFLFLNFHQLIKKILFNFTEKTKKTKFWIVRKCF